MLITPIVPKVMARPMAASSSTEPRETPYQTFWSAFQRARRERIPRRPTLRPRRVGGCAGTADSKRQGILVAALA